MFVPSESCRNYSFSNSGLRIMGKVGEGYFINEAYETKIINNITTPAVRNISRLECNTKSLKFLGQSCLHTNFEKWPVC